MLMVDNVRELVETKWKTARGYTLLNTVTGSQLKSELYVCKLLARMPLRSNQALPVLPVSKLAARVPAAHNAGW